MIKKQSGYGYGGRWLTKNEISKTLGNVEWVINTLRDAGRLTPGKEAEVRANFKAKLVWANMN